MTFERFYRAVLKRWAIVVICFVFLGLGTYIGSAKFIKPVYQSTALIEVIVRAGGTALNNDNILASQQLAETESNLATTDSVLATVAARYPGLTAEELSKNVTATVKSNTQLFLITVQDPDPKRAANLANDIANALTQQQLKATQQPTTEGSFLFLAGPARPALLPVRPNKTLNTAAGLLVGLLIGILLAVILELTDTRIRTKEELAALLSWPILSVIKRTGTKSELISSTGHNINSDAYGVLRTDLEFSSVDKPLRTIVVTSALPGEGKSIIAANLAISMAKAGKTTLLIDANLRRPTLHELFDIPGHAMGFSNAILAFRMAMSNRQQSRSGNGSATEEYSLTPFIRTVNIPNLSVMPSGPLPPNPSELLSSKAMQRFSLVLAQNGIEAVIFDTTSLPGLADAAILASKVDGTLMVVDITRARSGELKQAKEILEQAGAHVVGCVINKQRDDSKNTPYKQQAHSYEQISEKRVSSAERREQDRQPSGPTPIAPLTSIPAVPPVPTPAHATKPISSSSDVLSSLPTVPVPAATMAAIPPTPVQPRPVTTSTPRPAPAPANQRMGAPVPARPSGQVNPRPTSPVTPRPTGLAAAPRQEAAENPAGAASKAAKSSEDTIQVSPKNLAGDDRRPDGRKSDAQDTREPTKDKAREPIAPISQGQQRGTGE